MVICSIDVLNIKWDLKVLKAGPVVQHHVSDGPFEAVEENVWQNKSTGNYNNACKYTRIYFYLI